jgi:GxxExxY protein
MPIFLQHPIQQISDKSFHELDYEIMKVIFQIHNDLGRFYDEGIYQAELQRRCKSCGIGTTREFEIKLIHESFEKTLFIDFVIANSTVYELKATKTLVSPNRTQTLNYLFATNTQHGKLANFGTKSVEHEFVSTQLNHDKRKAFFIDERAWSTNSLTEQLRDILIDLLKQWGTFFDTGIYLDGLCHFLGGKELIIRDTIIYNENTKLGTQKIPHLSDQQAFCLTSVSNNISAYKRHLIRFVKHTKLDYLHCINFNNANIQFTSLKRESFCP